MRTTTGGIIIIAILLLLDFYIFSVIRSIWFSSSPKTRFWIGAVYWFLAIVSIAGMILFVYTSPEVLGRKVRTYLFSLIAILFFAKLAAATFFIIDDLRRFFQWGGSKLFLSNTAADPVKGQGISRSAFMNWLGLAAGTSIFGTFLYGFGNQYNYHVIKQKLSFLNLPPAFRGLRILHISDIHSGTFMNPKAVQRGIDKIMAQKADIILFTGDLVNDMASEMKEYAAMFSRLNAPMGVYSVLGNHDYGDYMQWPQNGLTKHQNLERLKEVQAGMGWKLLLNEHVVLKRGEDEIALIGIENWSAKARFPKYGKMEPAYRGCEKYPFKILMSHDPSHWDAEIRPKYPDIDLMLSGHTHGMQFGVEIPGFKWSPIEYVYKQWAGLYEEGKQKLYVNRGFGCIGYPGRVGILPEITLIELA